jgi:CubicO group peptidase (beta-lactamase class C family)
MRESEIRELGFGPERLSLLTAKLQKWLDRGTIPGAVVAVGRRGKLAMLSAVGFRDREERAEMAPNTIFRVASLTKPITSLAAMVLVEEGRLRLWDPVSLYLPALAGLKVGVEHDAGKFELVPAWREPVVLDLLRHTSGFTHDLYGSRRVKLMYREAGLRSATNAADFISRLAKLPLQAQPGTEWSYSFSIDILGHIIEQITGLSLDKFVASTITEPLGMKDTGFVVPPADLGRLAQPQTDPKTGQRPQMIDPSVAPGRFSGGFGMVSTCADYASFCQFWLNNGALNGKRLISRKTVELMTADHLPPEVRIDADVLAQFGLVAPGPTFGYGFGLGFAVRTHTGRSPLHGSIGDYWWMGDSGCAFMIDPAEQLYAILLAQAPERLSANLVLLRGAVYQALVD